MWYTFADELLSHRIIRLYFDVSKGQRLWKTKAFRLFNHHVLEERSGSAFLYSVTGLDNWIGGRVMPRAKVSAA